MANLTLVLWLVLFPLGCAIEKYLNVKRNEIAEHEQPSQISFGIVALIEAIIWVYVAFKLS